MALTSADAKWMRGDTGDGETSYGMQFRATFLASLRDVARGFNSLKNSRVRIPFYLGNLDLLPR